jgi:hypothetical protein
LGQKRPKTAKKSQKVSFFTMNRLTELAGHVALQQGRLYKPGFPRKGH